MTFRDIVKLWPTIQAFADDVGVGYEAARKMAARDTISEVHWQAVVDAAKRRGYRLSVRRGKTTRRESVSLHHLMIAAAAKRRARRQNPNARPRAAA